MEILDKLRYFFQVDFPETLNGIISYFIYDLGGVAWLLFIIGVGALSFLLLKSGRKNRQLINLNEKEEEFLKELSLLNKAMDIEDKIFDFALKTLKCRYSALYELRGETYISIGSNTSISEDNKKVGISMRLSRNKLSKMSFSGNYKIYKILSADEKHLLVLYSTKSINIERFNGLLQMSLGYYQAVETEAQTTSDKQLAKVNEETMQAIVKAQFGKEGYLKFLIAIILKIFNAKGGIIESHDSSEQYEVGDINFDMKKEFFIRNTPYKFKYFNDTEIEIDQIKEIGAFLDLSGSFLVSLDHQSSIMQNYIKFLKNANRIMEHTTEHYLHHSTKVKIVAVEVAKNLFVDQATLNNIELAAELHDIGMIGNMEMILNQDSKLGEKEIDLMHYHPVIGSILLEPIAHLYPITNIVKQHHERYDGRGYPNKVKGSDIALDSQTVSLAEHFVGLISDRSYKKGMPFDDAVEEVKKVAGKMFDPVIVNSFVESKSKILKKFVKLESGDRTS